MKMRLTLTTITLITVLMILSFKELENSGNISFPAIEGFYTAGDFHQHSTFTDGSYSIGYVMAKNNEFHLDWWANSEHGGGFKLDGANSGLDLGVSKKLIDYVPNPVKGLVNGENMWRWQSLKEYSFPAILKARAEYPKKSIIQGYEWNVPGHEHASMAIIANQFETTPNANPIAEFEYKFDGSDADNSGGELGWGKSTNTNHTKTIEAIKWLQTNYRTTSWVIPAHPERKSKYTISDFRDMNNAGPDVCFGFESMPGHQRSPNRGEYQLSSNTYGTCTYGGTGKMAASIGGLWDAMLSEGRKWWLFTSSDFHSLDNDFYPGEYQKTYVNVAVRNNGQAIVDGMRSGNAFVVTGNLINALEFSIEGKTMGQTANISRNSVTIKIRLHDPAGKLNHLDIIAGKVNGIIAPGSADYNNDDVSQTTRVIARFDAIGGQVDPNSIKSDKWTNIGNGLKEMRFVYKNVNYNAYFRLRGTNQGLNTPNETDAAGNPLGDNLVFPNNTELALSDLWFYSNPIFTKNK